MVVVVAVVGCGGGDLVEFEVTDASGCGRWLVEEPRRRGGGLPISRQNVSGHLKQSKKVN